MSRFIFEGNVCRLYVDEGAQFFSIDAVSEDNIIVDSLLFLSCFDGSMFCFKDGCDNSVQDCKEFRI